jgi:hypothetical protein
VATTVIDIIKVELDNGDKIECKPLKIRNLRKFMNRIKGLDDVVQDNDKSVDVLLECCQIALDQYVKDGYSLDELEDLLDLPTMYRIIEGASGIRLNDEGSDSPN